METNHTSGGRKANSPWGKPKEFVSLQRISKDELLKAVKILETRGFEMMGEPIEVESGGYDKGSYNNRYQRHGSGTYNSNKVWFVKMKKGVIK